MPVGFHHEHQLSCDYQGRNMCLFHALSQEFFPRNLETYVALCGATEFSNAMYCIPRQDLSMN